MCILLYVLCIASSDSEDETVERGEVDEHSDDSDDLDEQGQGEVAEDDGEGVQLFAGQAPLLLSSDWKKGGALADKKIERRRRKKKRKKLDKETKETLRRQEVATRIAHR